MTKRTDAAATAGAAKRLPGGADLTAPTSGAGFVTDIIISDEDIEALETM